MSDDLKPCPFCKVGDSLQDLVNFDGYHYVGCECGAEGPASPDKEGAVAAWNTRPGEEALEPCCVQCFHGLSDSEQEGAYVAACNVCGKELE